MTLNARETMQALLDGETVIMWAQEGCRVFVKLSEDDMLVCRTDDETEYHEPKYTAFNHAESIYVEYPLNFELALRAMLNGKVVRSNYCPCLKQRFHDGCFESNDNGTEWRDTSFPYEEQKAKWKVVE